MLKEKFHNIFILSNEEKKAILKEKNNYEDSRASSIEALKIVQKNRGWVSKRAIYAISKILEISASDLEEVATFYSQIFRRPVGRNVIRYCDSVVCYMHGCENIRACLENKLNIVIGETTRDFRFTLLPICCLGNCDKAPTLMINDNIYSRLTLKTVVELLELYQ
ncbi:MAG: NADH-quinone oxidoreductase subunit NuoE [Buchnera aphidicola (Meitanaphis microgallis)]